VARLLDDIANLKAMLQAISIGGLAVVGLCCAGWVVAGMLGGIANLKAVLPAIPFGSRASPLVWLQAAFF